MAATSRASGASGWSPSSTTICAARARAERRGRSPALYNRATAAASSAPPPGGEPPADRRHQQGRGEMRPEQGKTVADALRIVEERGLSHVKDGVFVID